MNVLFVSSEAVPFAKTGGLADVVGSLPKALRKLDVDARVIMPAYAVIDKGKYNIQHMFSFPFPRRTGTVDVHVYTTVWDTIPFYFVQGWPYFGQESQIYDGWSLDVDRFIFLNQVAMAVAWEMRQRHGWFPNIFHVNDWHTGLIPFLLYESRFDPVWSKVASLLTIHNMAYQGNDAGGWFWQQGIPGRHQPDLVYQDLTDNMLAIGLAYADLITAVSPRYAIEIQFPFMGYGLQGLVRTRPQDVYGILNGIDMDHLNPATDPKITTNYSVSDFEDRRIGNKRQLQADLGLATKDDVPIIGLVSRLDPQKGIDLAVPALRRLLESTNMQFIGLGTGNPDLNHELWRIGADFPERARTFITYDGELAQRIYAGSDVFLMPSHYEPCGIGQMIAMRYGSLPLVRETGGLADTVANYDNGPADVGTGFVFNWTEPEALLNTINWALGTYHNHRDAWVRMQERGMSTDFSWDKSARQYVDLYHKIIR